MRERVKTQQVISMV